MPPTFTLQTAAEIALSPYQGGATFSDSAIRAEALWSALSAQDAAAAYARAAQLAKTPEQVLREQIASQRAQVRRLLDIAQEHRAWRRIAAADGLGTLGFFHDEVPALLQAVRRHRRSAQAASAQLAAMLSAQAHRAAA